MSGKRFGSTFSPGGALVTTDRLDHVHLNVIDRPAAIGWYQRVFGLRVIGDENPADDHPVFLAPAQGDRLCLSLFVGEPAQGPNRNIAFHAGAAGFTRFARNLPNPDVIGHHGRALTAEDVHDYGMAMNFDFLDPDRNHVELVTYDCDAVRKALAA